MKSYASEANLKIADGILGIKPTGKIFGPIQTTRFFKTNIFNIISSIYTKNQNLKSNVLDN